MKADICQSSLQLTFVLCLLVYVQGDCLRDCCVTLRDRAPQNYTYYQDSGRFTGGAGEFRIDTYGYSGAGSGRMNPDM